MTVGYLPSVEDIQVLNEEIPDLNTMRLDHTHQTIFFCQKANLNFYCNF